MDDYVGGEILCDIYGFHFQISGNISLYIVTSMAYKMFGHLLVKIKIINKERKENIL